MAFKKYDLVQETSTSTGTGNIALGGAVTRRRAFSAVLSNGDTCHVLIEHASAAEWEICQASYVSAGNQLARSTVLASSTGAAVSFSAGSKTISMIPPSARIIVADDNGDISITRDVAVGRDVTAVRNVGAQAYLVNGVTVISRSGSDVIHWDDTGNAALKLQAQDAYVLRDAQVTRNVNAQAYLVSGVTVVSRSGSDVIHWDDGGNAALKLKSQDAYILRDALVTRNVNAVEYKISTVTALNISGNYVQHFDSGGGTALKVGNATDPSNYHSNDTHLFYNRAVNAEFGRISSTTWRPGSDNALSMGTGSFRWSVVYAGTGTINTSGRDTKVGIRAPLDAERRAAQRILAIGPKLYKFKDAVDEKGEAARLHAGYVAEDVRDALAAEGLNPWAYGFMCADPVTVQETYTEQVERPRMVVETVTETVVEVREGRPIQVEREVERKQPVGQFVEVVNEAGEPVMMPAADGDEPVPMLHFVPEMETIEETRTRSVPLLDTAGSPVIRLGLRYSELEAFLKAAI